MKQYSLMLINPAGAFLSRDTRFEKFWRDSLNLETYRFLWSGFGIGLLNVAGLTPDCFEIEVVDENFDRVDFNKTPDLVGITAMTQQILGAYRLADRFRENGVKVVLGGIHATVLPKEAKEHADAVVIGEAEEIWPKLIKDFLANDLQPFYQSDAVPDLTRPLLPRYDLLKQENYKTIWVQTTRGCPHNCEFCAASTVYGRQYRTKALGAILQEIDLIKDIWNSPQISFADDNMFVKRAFSRDLLRQVKRRRINWLAQTDISVAEDETFLAFLQECGCMALFIGFESLLGDSLASIDSDRWKLKFLERYPEAIERIQSRGIGVIGAFILGFDTDDHTVFERTKAFILENRLYGAQVSVLTPLPGTRLRERLAAEGRIVSNDWSRYTLWDVNYEPANLCQEELQEGLLEISKAIYSQEVRLETALHFKQIYSAIHEKTAINK